MSNPDTTLRELRPIHVGWMVLILSCVLTLVPLLRDTGTFLMPFAIGYIMGCSSDGN